MASKATRFVAGIAVAALSIGLVALPATAASAATTTVGKSVTTTDLNAVGMSPGTLAADLAGSGVTVSNVTYSGANAQAGRIHAADPAVVSFNDGVIMSSGHIADVGGPNKSDGITGDMGGPADGDLNTLIANTQTVNPVTFDAASIEFDFVPQASQVYFTYTFGSDEYLEWVNQFNDVFAFYINGQNCATVPNGDPVSINTINDNVNPTFFRDNSFSNPPTNPINVESDGLSVEMICSANVNPGQVNHMKLAIADTSDQILDSVVMIKANSLSTTKPESCNDGTDNDDDGKVDMNDDSCTSTTTQPPTGGSGVGSSGKPPAFTGNEGTPIALDASALAWTPSSDTVSTSWTVTGINGTPGTCTVEPAARQPLNGDGTIATATTICPNEGEYVARVDGWDVEDKSAFDKDVDFFVHNAPPAVSIAAPTSGSQFAVGDSVDLVAAAIDPGANDTVTCQIKWGDGTTDAGTYDAGQCTASHQYSAIGQHMISVTATDEAGSSSATVTVVEITDPNVAPVAPSAPGALTATPGSSKATLVWNAPFDGGAAIDGYRVQVATAPADSYVTAKGCATLGDVTTCTATGLKNGTGYFFKVAGHNSAGWGDYSAASAMVTPAAKPGLPLNPTGGSAGLGKIAAAWQAPTSDGGSQIDNYLARAFNGGTATSRYCYATDLAGCTITGLPAGSYTVKVQAHNATGWGARSLDSSPVAVTGVAQAPQQSVAASAGPGKIVATWAAPASDGGLVIDDYLARAYVGTTATSRVCHATSPAGCTIVGLTGGAYSVRVQAHNAAGWSPRSVDSKTLTITGAASQPLKVTATPGTAGRLVAAWDAPASNGGEAIDKYLVKAFLDGVTVSTRTCSATMAKTCTITGLPAGKYTVRVQARNVAGWGARSGDSNLVTIG